MNRVCVGTTKLGQRCKRPAEADGLCFTHRTQHAGAEIIDPLEVIDWSRHAEAVATAHRAAERLTHQGEGRQPVEYNPTNLAVIEHSRRPERLARIAELREQMNARRLTVVPEPDWSLDDEAALVPDVIGADRQRALYRAAMPNLTERELDEFVEVFKNSMAPATVRSYEAALTPFYDYAHEHGFDPLECEPMRIEAYLLDRMISGKLGSTGVRDPDRPYSVSYFKMFLAALRHAAAAQGLPDPTGPVNIDTLTRGYNRTRGSTLPREGKTELLPEHLIEIERRSREGTTLRALTLRAVIALGCDSDLGLSGTEMAALTFGDIASPDGDGDPMVITTQPRGNRRTVEIAANPQNPACPVAAVGQLRDAVRLRMRSERKGTPPTKTQINAQHVFLNYRTGDPLSRTGIKHVAARACDTLTGVAPPQRGKLPALTADQRRRVVASGDDTATARDLALVFHTAFASARVGNVSTFNVGHVTIWGHDSDNITTSTPLVDTSEPDGTVTPGLLDLVATITTSDILNADGNSLCTNGLIAGVHTTFRFGTKTQQFHENWYPVQPGHPACPVRLLLRWLKAYDRLLLATRGRRLTADDALFCNLKRPGEPISHMTKLLGGLVKAAMADLGHNPDDYSAHSLRKLRASYVLSQGGSMTDVMVHDGRSSEATGLVYAHRNPNNPFKGDPTVAIYHAHTPQPAPPAGGTMNTPNNGHPTSTPPPAADQNPASTTASGDLAENIAALRHCVNSLRHAGLDNHAITAIAGLDSL